MRQYFITHEKLLGTKFTIYCMCGVKCHCCDLSVMWWCKVCTSFLVLVEVFWIVMLCSAVVGYQHFRGPSTQRQHGPPNHWYPTVTLHSITTQKTLTSFQSLKIIQLQLLLKNIIQA